MGFSVVMMGRERDEGGGELKEKWGCGFDLRGRVVVKILLGAERDGRGREREEGLPRARGIGGGPIAHENGAVVPADGAGELLAVSGDGTGLYGVGNGFFGQLPSFISVDRGARVF